MRLTLIIAAVSFATLLTASAGLTTALSLPTKAEAQERAAW